MVKYNCSDIKNIKKYIDNHEWYKALVLLQEYCKKYPKDYGSLSQYLHILLRVGYIKEARNVIDSIDFSSIKHDKTLSTIRYALLKLLILEEKYEEALKLIQDDFEFKMEDEIYYVKAYLKNKLNLPIISSEYPGYMYTQLLSYSEDRLLEFIKSEHFGCNEDKSYFHQDIDINKLIEVIKENIDAAPKIYGILYNELYFKYPNCGIYHDKVCDYVFVTVLNNTEQIMMINPTLNKDRYASVDITQMMVQDNGSVRRKSQIDKFNEKYGNHIK